MSLLYNGHYIVHMVDPMVSEMVITVRIEYFGESGR
jgi:hypothetical protein